MVLSEILGFSFAWIQENTAAVVNCKNIEFLKIFNDSLKLSKLFKLCFLNAYFLDTWLQWYNHGLQKKRSFDNFLLVL